ncbi:MAG: hypothetical protein ACN4GT_10770 [Gammaproteobacteria bacterium]
MVGGSFIRSIRQLLVVTVALAIAGGSYLTRARTTSWEEPLWVTVYPIAADDRDSTRRYVDRLTPAHFESIEAFLERETIRYGVTINRPIRIDVGDEIDSMPPVPPFGGNPLEVISWSFKMRWWASDVTSENSAAPPDIKLFVIYHDPSLSPSVPHSLGLQKGMLGVVHVFADKKMKGSNQFVIAHEMLHTLGATDKYEPQSNHPIFPIGYAEPHASPRFPQRFAEIMGGRIPVSASESRIPPSLQQARVGPATALELRWISELPARPQIIATERDAAAPKKTARLN